MSDLVNRLRARMGALANPLHKPSPRNRTRQNVDHHVFDREAWFDARKDPDIDQAVEDLLDGDERERPPYDNGPELLQDTFYALYKSGPRFQPKRVVEKDARLNRQIMQAIMGDARYHQIHDITATDPVLSQVGLKHLIPVIQEILTRRSDEAQQSNEQRREAEQGQAGQESEPGEGEGEGEQEGKPEKGKPQDQADEQQEQPEEGEDEQDEPEGQDGEGDSGDENDDGEGNGEDEDEEDDDLDDDLARLLEEGMNDLANDLRDLESIRRSIGLEDGEWRMMSPEKRLALLQRFQSPEMRQLAEMVGRMKRFALSLQADKILDVPHEIYNVTKGDDVQHLLGSEFALLAHPDTRYEFYRRYLDKELLQFALRGKTNANQGPIAIGIDRSGSMDGHPLSWAMAVAESLRQICQEQKRDFFALFFDHRVQNQHLFHFKGGQAAFDDVLRFLSVGADGGTDFQEPLDKLLQVVSGAYNSGLDKADIVFLTDGQAHLDPEWQAKFRAEKERVGCRVFGVFIGGARDMRYATPTMDAFSDVVVSVHELLAAGGIGRVFTDV